MTSYEDAKETPSPRSSGERDKLLTSIVSLQNLAPYALLCYSSLLPLQRSPVAHKWLFTTIDAPRLRLSLF